LRGLVAELASERGLKVDYVSVWRFVHAEGLTHKKRMARPVCKVKSDGMSVCINVSGLRAAALAKMGSALPGPHKDRGVEHHIFDQAAKTPVRPLSHLSFTSADLVSGSGVDRPLSLLQAAAAWCS
jgi:hypothetical protein